VLPAGIRHWNHSFSFIFIDKEVAGMLILSRKAGERIKLGDSIVLTVVGVSGDKVLVGIQAPSDVLVLRDELQPYAAEKRTLKLRAAA